MSDDVIFSIFYLILSICIIYPPAEFVSAGFTIPGIFSKVLGSEDEHFVQYHIKRIIIAVGVYSSLPLGYLSFLFFTNSLGHVVISLADSSLLWRIFFTSSVALPILGIFQIRYWIIDNYKNHPVVANLLKFCNNNDTDFNSVASNINAEFRRVDKILIQTNPLVKVVVTENWILKITPFTVLLAHQSDTNLVVKQADTHQISVQTSAGIQYLTIDVQTSRRNVDNFTIRINSTDFKDLEDRVCRNITILPNVRFHKTVVEQFMDVFKDMVARNPVYRTPEALEQCIGCMQTRSNVKLQKLCDDSDVLAENKCAQCYCKPLWCVDCMARWFASRQESDQQDTWLSSKCTCPMCRAKFCILDVSFTHSIEE